MTSPSDAAVVATFLARASRRIRWRPVLAGTTAGLVGAIIATFWLQIPLASIAIALVGAAVGLVLGRGDPARVAAVVEARAPQCRNILITAQEVIDQRSRVEPYVRALVLHEAASVANALDLQRLVPLQNVIAAAAACAGLWLFAATRSTHTAVAAHSASASAAAVAAISAVDVEVTDPAYLGGTTRVRHDPARIDVRVGSRIRLSVRADGDAVALETLDGRRALTAAAGRTFTGEFLADADGYLALEPVTAGGRAGARRLIGVSVMPDHPPIVRITAPGRDLKFLDGKQTVNVTIEASDDNALASLRLKYTRVSGSGERFTFTEGDVPLTIVRHDARSWRAHASWHLDSLTLDAGDMVVYRAVAADGRPGAAPSESDSYIAEVLAPGGVAAAGFAVDPEVERYALSEQMVILKTEKLLARKGVLSAPDYADGAADLSAEQRGVRAVFVFMMGGEVGGADDATGDLNEEAETSGEGDLAAQRMLNQGRAALLSAIRAMSRAGTALTTPDLTLALTDEKTALTQLEKTFSHTRIILRALTEHERLDLTRRLTGTLTDAATDVEPVVAADGDPRARELRRVLSDIAGTAAPATIDASTSARISMLAERVLRVDPSSTAGQQAGATLDSAARAIHDGHPADAHLLLDHAATDVAGILRAGLFEAPLPATDGDAPRLAGALTDALRHHP